MSEVDKLDDTIDHRVSQCYQRINTAQRNAVNKLLDKLLHKGTHVHNSRPPDLVD